MENLRLPWTKYAAFACVFVCLSVCGLRAVIPFASVLLAGFPRDDLVVAAGNGNIRRIHLLCALGADPSLVGWEEHYTPLDAAVLSGHIDVARLLLRYHADVNRKDDYGKTALHYAHFVKDANMIALLKQAGARE